MAMSRKRKAEDVHHAFQDAFRSVHASRRDTWTIWNAAVDSGHRIGPGKARRGLDREQAVARECYDLHVLPSAGDGPQQGVYIADLSRILNYLVSKVPAWDRELFLRVSEGDTLEAILYADDVTCGNILAPIKKKKPTTIYCSFRCLWRTIDCVECWIPICLVQRTQLDCIDGGLSCLLRHVVLSLHSHSNEQGFAVRFPHGARTLRLAKRSFLLYDHEAQREIYGLKGSARASALRALQQCFE